MSFIGNAIGSVLGGITGANQQAAAAQQAAQTQAGAAQAGIDATNQRFQQYQQLAQPFVTAGTGALGSYQDLLGVNGPDKQAAAIAQIQGSPAFTSQQTLGENRILANASATGGLRGGNVQGALSQFSPQLLSQLIQQQMQGYGGLITTGQNAAAGVGTAGMANGQQVAGLLGQQGAATAGGQLAEGSVVRSSFGDALKLASLYAGANGGFGSAFGGSGGMSNAQFLKANGF